MSIRMSCACGKRWKVDDDLEGKRVRCPKCGERVKVRSRSSRDDKQPKEEDSGDVKDSSSQRSSKQNRQAAILAAVFVAMLGVLGVVGWIVYESMGGGSGGLIGAGVAIALGLLASFFLILNPLLKPWLEGNVWWLKFKLRSGSKDDRVLAVQKLVELQGEAALDLVLEATKDSKNAVRSAAYEALARFSSDRARKALFSGVKDQAGYVRATVYSALANMAGDRARTLLLAGLEDEDSEARGIALIAMEQSKDPELREQAAQLRFNREVAKVNAEADQKSREAQRKLDEIKAEMKRIKLMCAKCHNFYNLGKDSSVYTPEELAGYQRQHGTVHLGGGPMTSAHTPDVVSRASQPDTDDPSLQVVLKALSAAASRQWKCECGHIQPYDWVEVRREQIGRIVLARFGVNILFGEASFIAKLQTAFYNTENPLVLGWWCDQALTADSLEAFEGAVLAR